MPTENTAQKLAKLVRTTQGKVTLVDHAHSLLNDLSRTSPPSTQAIQNNYPFLYKILRECYPETSNGVEQKDVEQLLVDASKLEEVIFTVPSSIGTPVDDKLCKWTTENIDDAAITNCIPSNEIVGGVAISYRGRFINLSLDKIVKEKVYA